MELYILYQNRLMSKCLSADYFHQSSLGRTGRILHGLLPKKVITLYPTRQEGAQLALRKL